MADQEEMRANHIRAVGVMSGTSTDAIDAAIVDIAGSGAALHVALLAFHSTPMPPGLRARALQVCLLGGGNTRLICELNVELGETFARAAQAAIAAAGLKADDIDLIGSHGQTVWHQGIAQDGSIASTLQLGEPSVIAERTGVTTVADFRPRDMAAGGQGAPLVSYLDWALYRSDRAGRALQNIGGIANVTVLPAACGLDDVFAFDTGPGNMLMDALATIGSDGALTYDRDGALARRGRVQPALLRRILAHPFFDQAPPRTAGREQFGQDLARELWQEGSAADLSAADLLATATLATARSIAQAYRRWVLPRLALEGMYLSGGGARNPALLDALQRELPEVRQRPLSDLGGDAQAKEAIAFAVLAAETVRAVPTSLPGATGARHAAVLGKIVPGANWARLQQRLAASGAGIGGVIDGTAGGDGAVSRRASAAGEPAPTVARRPGREQALDNRTGAGAVDLDHRSDPVLHLPAGVRADQVCLGIDGGGSVTTGVALDASGRVLVSANAGPANVRAAGWAVAAASLETVVQTLAAGLPPGTGIVGMHAALAGAGRADDALAVRNYLFDLCREPALATTCAHLGRTDIGVSNDALAVLAAADLRAGIVVVAGTGSLVWGCTAAGETARAGGWGYLLGDAGSGYDLGHRALTMVLAEYDRQEPRSVLSTNMLAQLGLRDPPDLVERVYGASAARTDIAALAPEVLRLMAAGDATAQELVRRSVQDLAHQIGIVAVRLRFYGAPHSVVCSGGLFRNDQFFRALQEALSGDSAVSCTRPRRPPAEGAALLAWNARSLAVGPPDGA